MRERRRARVALAAVLGLLVTAGCSVEQEPKLFDPSQNGGSPASPARQEPQGPVRAGPVALPVTYELGAPADGYELPYYNGRVFVGEEPVEVTFGFRVEETARNNSKLLASNLEQWQERNVTPETFEADGETGYFYEEVFTAENDAEPGTSRFYVVAKGAVTVTLTVFAPEGTELSQESRDAGDALAASIVFDESGLTGEAGTDQGAPAVPFTFVPQPSLPGPFDAEFGGLYWADYTFGDQQVQVSLREDPEAEKTYRDKYEQAQGSPAKPVDIKTAESTANTIGKQVDEGYGVAPSSGGDTVLMYFMVRKGDLILEINAPGEGTKPLPLPIREAVTGILGTATFSQG
ncbi:hypothetical protein BAY61_06120 [Prauserella marina]|uniref:Uncharacterized protein n=1 Tax=Prauserella marina TaxID=530584 RepID=A0A222VL26_9PSEU|nr:hypothetical protein [Prauserella marina]ASR34630.1 hypothetical protein BAY61_06120 [Prauserella marina]PWV85730.1 hypothetical protein DES30_1011760 [Prauserella marina]SDC47120.1 hypothetical protein SAMN05421630_102232 [Prauserella marina]